MPGGPCAVVPWNAACAVGDIPRNDGTWKYRARPVCNVVASSGRYTRAMLGSSWWPELKPLKVSQRIPREALRRSLRAPQIAHIDAADVVIRMGVVDDRQGHNAALLAVAVGGKHQRGVTGADAILRRIEAAAEGVRAAHEAHIALERVVVIVVAGGGGHALIDQFPYRIGLEPLRDRVLAIGELIGAVVPERAAERQHREHVTEVEVRIDDRRRGRFGHVDQLERRRESWHIGQLIAAARGRQQQGQGVTGSDRVGKVAEGLSLFAEIMNRRGTRSGGAEGGVVLPVEPAHVASEPRMTGPHTRSSARGCRAARRAD